MCLKCLRKMNSEDGQLFTLFVYSNFLVLLSTTVCSLNINKQIVNIEDENLTDYSFLSRYHYTNSKNYLRRRYRIRHWIPMFIGTPCNYLKTLNWKTSFKLKLWRKINLKVGMLTFSFFWKTIVSLWRRRRKIENETIVFKNDSFYKTRRFVNDP